MSDDEEARQAAAIDAMLMRAGMIKAPPGYDPDEAAKGTGWSAAQIDAEVEATMEAWSAWEAEEARRSSLLTRVGGWLLKLLGRG